MEEQIYHLEDLSKAYNIIVERLRSIEQLLQKKEVKTSEAKLDEPLTIEQAAVILHLSKATIYSKVSRKEIPYNKKGNRLYFFQSELIAYLKKGKQKTLDEIQTEAEDYVNDFQKKAA